MNIQEIKIGNRFRKDLGNLSNLVDSIKKGGRSALETTFDVSLAREQNRFG